MKNYRDGNISGIVKVISERFGIDAASLLTLLETTFPKMGDKSRCPNCDASMQEYIFKFDVLDAILLMRMADEVRLKMEKNVAFTAANAVHVPSMSGLSHAIKCRTTQCSKLGLIAKSLTEQKRQVPGQWLITKRGWDALRGEFVPAMVAVFRNRIEERFDERTTIRLIFEAHTQAVLTAKERNWDQHDYRMMFSGYEPNQYVHIAGIHSGELL